jgi:hypothetical protein
MKTYLQCYSERAYKKKKDPIFEYLEGIWNLYFSSNCDAVFSLKWWFLPVVYGQISLSLMVLKINFTERGQHKPNFKLLIHIQFQCILFLSTWSSSLVMDGPWKKLLFHFEKGRNFAYLDTVILRFSIADCTFGIFKLFI